MGPLSINKCKKSIIYSFINLKRLLLFIHKHRERLLSIFTAMSFILIIVLIMTGTLKEGLINKSTVLEPKSILIFILLIGYLNVLKSKKEIRWSNLPELPGQMIIQGFEVLAQTFYRAIFYTFLSLLLYIIYLISQTFILPTPTEVINFLDDNLSKSVIIVTYILIIHNLFEKKEKTYIKDVVIKNIIIMPRTIILISILYLFYLFSSLSLVPINETLINLQEIILFNFNN